MAIYNNDRDPNDIQWEKDLKSTSKKLFKVAVTWEVYGVIEVEAESVREAVNLVNDHPEEYDLPKDFSYVDDSFVADYDSSEFINITNGEEI
jgi:hypothetical protein